jgi:SAM-dependent methyltransferase
MKVPPTITQCMRRVLYGRVHSRRLFQQKVAGKYGLEIGGPSPVFDDPGELPLYRYLAGLDNCVFAGETIWEGKRQQGQTFSYHRKKEKGFNFILEATDLGAIGDHKYDFVLSSHSLEHISNPVRALKEWMRVVKPEGALIVLLPNYRRTFDHRRRPTAIAHMVEDYVLGRDEGDLTHLPEILELHDLTRDPGLISREQFVSRSHRNLENRCLHHHVFDEGNSKGLLEVAGLNVEVLELAKPFHIAILARSPGVRNEFVDDQLPLGSTRAEIL